MGHKRKQRDVKTASNCNLFFGSSSKDFKNVADKLAFVFHAVKYNISYRRMDWTNKLSKEIFQDYDSARRCPVARQMQSLL
jgi:hypothetical protein